MMRGPLKLALYGLGSVLVAGALVATTPFLDADWFGWFRLVAVAVLFVMSLLLISAGLRRSVRPHAALTVWMWSVAGLVVASVIGVRVFAGINDMFWVIFPLVFIATYVGLCIGSTAVLAQDESKPGATRTPPK